MIETETSDIANFTSAFTTAFEILQKVCQLLILLLPSSAFVKSFVEENRAHVLAYQTI
jgi:hypothetical protein